MGLAETQRALARLYTDARLRERFYAAPSEVGRELGLDEQDAQSLALLGARQTDHFAASLVNKRLGEVSKLLPLTARVLGQEFRRLFRQFAAAEPAPAGLSKHLRDAVAFAEYAGRGGRLASVAPVWLVELLRYEKELLRAREAKTRLRLCLFRYDVRQLARSVSQDPTSPHVEVRPMLALWLRLGARGRVRHRLLPLARRK